MRNCRIVLMLTLIFALMFLAIPVFPARADEALIWSGTVSSDGTTTTGPVLSAMTQYRIVANGIWYWYYPIGAQADAMYYTNSSNWTYYGPAPAGHSWLQINEMDVNWGSFNTIHTYSISFMGTGSAITFRIVDWFADSADASCHLNVEVYKICRAPGFTPGFWKHNIEVRLGLTKGAYNAFEGGPLDGVKLTDAMMDGFLADINATLGASFTFEQLLGFLELEGWSPDRTNTANWFNWSAGYGPYN